MAAALSVLPALFMLPTLPAAAQSPDSALDPTDFAENGHFTPFEQELTQWSGL